MKTYEETANNTAAYVRCHGGLVEGDLGCGLQALTEEQYLAQLSNADKPWRCPSCGNSAHYDDTESERVQGVNEDSEDNASDETLGPRVAEPNIPAAERDRILALFAAAIDAPIPDGYAEQAKAVFAAAGEDIEATTMTHLLRTALFCDDVEVEHPELTASMVRRVAATCLLRAAVVCVYSAKKLEGDAFDPARFALVVFAESEHWLDLASKHSQDLLDAYAPGTLRAELEASGLISKREPESSEATP